MGWRDICENQDYGKISPQDVFTFFPCSHSCSILVTQSLSASRSMSQIPCVVEPPEQKWLQARIRGSTLHQGEVKVSKVTAPLVPPRPGPARGPPALCRPPRPGRPAPRRGAPHNLTTAREGGTWEGARLAARVPTPEAQKALRRGSSRGWTDWHVAHWVQRPPQTPGGRRIHRVRAVPLWVHRRSCRTHAPQGAQPRSLQHPRPGNSASATSGRLEQEDARPQRDSAAGRYAPAAHSNAAGSGERHA